MRRITELASKYRGAYLHQSVRDELRKEATKDYIKGTDLDFTSPVYKWFWYSNAVVSTQSLLQ